ncbi:MULTISPECIES: DUF2165 domain-containing protein [Streptomyces]|uniref:DUF2165 domain-containing protein n=1 Tax=Streptomyces ramulosus TaxID=47762 RepID=A0ABW1FHU1_9ACTN
MSERTTRSGFPVAAVVLTGIVALYMALVAFGNLTDFGTNREFVRHVLAMDTTFRDDDLMWRAVTSRSLQDGAYIAIIVWETLSAALLAIGAVWWALRLRRESPGRARTVAVAGLVMVLVLFGAGFLAVGGEWFAMWQSKQWNGLDAATRNFTVAGLALLVVQGAGRRETPATPADRPLPTADRDLSPERAED